MGAAWGGETTPGQTPGPSPSEIPASSPRCPRPGRHDRRMSNQYGPSDADPAGNQPTQQFWAGPDAPTATPGWGTPPGPGFTGHQAPGLPEQPKRDHRQALRWTAGLLVAVLLAGGGAIAGMRLAGHSSSTSGGAASGPAASAPQEGALLNETLNDA